MKKISRILPCFPKDTRHRYKSLTGFSIYACGVRYVQCTRYALRGRKGFISYRIYRKVNISIFLSGKNIGSRSNISTKNYPKRRFSSSGSLSIYSYKQGICVLNFVFKSKRLHIWLGLFFGFKQVQLFVNSSSGIGVGCSLQKIGPLACTIQQCIPNGSAAHGKGQPEGLAF